MVSVRNVLTKLFKNSDDIDRYDEIPNRDFRIASKNPLFREYLIEESIEEDDRNSYYTCLLDIVSDSCVGTFPQVLGEFDDNDVNDSIEDRWLQWCIMHQIGAALRECRRDACKTGLGIIIPYKKEDGYEHKLAFRNVCKTQLRSPLEAINNDNIVNGIEYDDNGDIVRIFVDEDTGNEPTPYNVPSEALVWKRPQSKLILPECGPAFCLFPSVRRVMKAIVRGEELNQSIPMAVRLDPQVYKPDDATEPPTGIFEYEPGMVPTLPPGTELQGLNIKPQGEERVKFIELVISAASRCKGIPKNIILGDSSGHNMATAQVDIEPWKNKVNIDRTDFETIVRQVFNLWFQGARLIDGYLHPKARNEELQSKFTYALNYINLFSHPDPNKKAMARLTDLISGSTTLYKIWTEEGKNPRRELEKDARLMGIESEQHYQGILAGRTKEYLQILGIIDGSTNGNNQQQ